jgi:hypothetical protein
MKLTSHKFLIVRNNLISFTTHVPYTIEDQRVDVIPYLNRLQPFEVELAYITNSLFRYTLRISCVFKERKW